MFNEYFKPREARYAFADRLHLLAVMRLLCTFAQMGLHCVQARVPRLSKRQPSAVMQASALHISP